MDQQVGCFSHVPHLTTSFVLRTSFSLSWSFWIYSQRVNIFFDKDYKVRVLDPIKFKHAVELENECGSFVSKIADFNERVNCLVEVLDIHALRIDKRKLKAIGLRMTCENECEQRLRKLRAFQALVAEKKAELDRYNTQCQSLERIEAEQKSLIEKMSSS